MHLLSASDKFRQQPRENLCTFKYGAALIKHNRVVGVNAALLAHDLLCKKRYIVLRQVKRMTVAGPRPVRCRAVCDDGRWIR